MKISSCSILILLYFVIFGLNKLNLYHLETKSERFYQKKENYKKVQDIFHDILPHIEHFEYVSDIITVSVIFYLALIRFDLLYHLGGLIFTLILLRQFIIQMTILPKNTVCDIKNTSMIRGGCYDKIFSGHFGITFLTTLVLLENGLINKFIALLVNLVNGIFILLSRNHYTIDIIVSIFVVIIIYQNNLNICDILDKYLEKINIS